MYIYIYMYTCDVLASCHSSPPLRMQTNRWAVWRRKNSERSSVGAGLKEHSRGLPKRAGLATAEPQDWEPPNPRLSALSYTLHSSSHPRLYPGTPDGTPLNASLAFIPFRFIGKLVWGPPAHSMEEAPHALNESFGERKYAVRSRRLECVRNTINNEAINYTFNKQHIITAFKHPTFGASEVSLDPPQGISPDLALPWCYGTLGLEFPLEGIWTLPGECETNKQTNNQYIYIYIYIHTYIYDMYVCMHIYIYIYIDDVYMYNGFFNQSKVEHLKSVLRRSRGAVWPSHSLY